MQRSYRDEDPKNQTRCCGRMGEGRDLGLGVAPATGRKRKTISYSDLITQDTQTLSQTNQSFPHREYSACVRDPPTTTRCVDRDLQTILLPRRTPPGGSKLY